MTRRSSRTSHVNSANAVKARRYPAMRTWARRLVALALAVLICTVAFDIASIAVVRISVADDADNAAFAAAAATQGRAITVDTAEIGFAAAQASADNDGDSALASGFSLHPDGSVTVTLQAKAPTVWADLFGWTRDLTVTEATKTSAGPS